MASGLTLSAEEMKAAPLKVREWLDHKIAGALGLPLAPKPPAEAAAVRPIGYDAAAGRGVCGRTSPAETDSTSTVGMRMNTIDEATKERAIRQLVAERAYAMWENQGQPQGRDLIHWRQAEQEIMSSIKEGSANAGSAPGGTVRSGRPDAARQAIPTTRSTLQTR